MLTKKQHDLLLYIHKHMKDGDVAPSFDEMKDALGLKSKSGIHRLITALVERGYLERLANRARAISIKKLPDSFTKKQEITDRNSETTHTDSGDIFKSDLQGVRPIPMYGKISAGTPVEAIRHEGSYFDAPLSLLGAGEYYALEVDGESMLQAGINDGDTAIIRRTDHADLGSIVVALVDGEEVTLKTLARDKGQVVLQPENDAFEPQYYNPDQVIVQGVLASIIRRY
ncbi:MAG: transcriptional repressor LexA [Alphaproteobacteria bacterium]|nr:transcriptional repressor LexA [Alphaproteobacteria bacterium]